MSILASLAKAYERLPDAPPFGFSAEKIGFLISLNADGSVANVTDLRAGAGNKKISPLMPVPQAVKRTVGIVSNFLWDKTSYVLGVTAGEGKRLTVEHAAFVKRHLEALAAQEDEGLKALCQFLTHWKPEQFIAPLWSDDIKDQNVVFALETERRKDIRIHDRPAAKNLWANLVSEGDRNFAACLVSGENAPVSRLHPSIKGVWGGQSSGASIVSFNLDAFTSYGHEQGENAPVSEAAVFAYTTALNRFLEKDSKNRVQLGDASTVFWADASKVEVAEEVESLFGSLFNDVDESMQSDKVGGLLAKIRSGLPIKDFAPELEKGVRFYVLGLAPNAARISIRFYFEDDFGTLAANYQRFIQDMQILPEPREGFPPFWKYLAETAVLGKRENVPPKLAGDWMRAILTGRPYPLTLISAVQMRIRADKDINALRVAMLKAVLIRNYKMEVPVALDTENRNKGYLLGRLFAAYEQAQRAALGDKVNATIKDKFYGTASAQPRRVFALLDKGSVNHLSKLGKAKPGYRVVIEREIAEIMGIMRPGEDPFPASMSAEEQALFGVGYYHQRNHFFKPKSDETLAIKDAT
jgi:CRISPR-associated protein Csd1